MPADRTKCIEHFEIDGDQITFKLSRSRLAAEIDFLKSNKIGSIVTLTENHDQQDELSRHFDLHHLAIEDLQAPQFEQAVELAKLLEDAKAENHGVAVHCMAGIGRTSTMLMAAHLILGELQLAQFGLSIADDKTHKTNLTSYERGSGERRRMSFLGFNIFRAKTRNGRGWKVVYQTDSKRFTRAKAVMKEKLKLIQHVDVKSQARLINSILIGHFNYYGIAGNSRHLAAFRWQTLCYWRRCLKRRSQQSFSWEKFEQIIKRFPLKTVSIRITYQDFASYVRL